jgi:hypothetical protein
MVVHALFRRALAVAALSSAFAAASLADNYGKAILADSPSGYWRLNETTGNIAADSSGNANAAYFQSDSTSFAQGQAGFLPAAGNAAVHFNGGSVFGPYNTNSAILSQDYSPSLQPFAYADTFTIEAWVKDTSPLPTNDLDPNNGSRMIFAGNFGFGLTELNEPHFVTYGRKDYFLTSVHVSPNQWHQMAVSYTGFDATFYLDGANIGVVSVTHNGGSAQTSTQFGIGRRTTAEAPWLGDIDEVAIYPSLLSDEQILNHYQAALSEFGDANGDGQVSFADLVAVAQNYGSAAGSFKSGDFNGDGTVSFADLVTVAQHYGAILTPPPEASAPQPVPEPATGVLLCAMMSATLVRRRSRTR